MEIFISPDTVHLPVSEEFSSAGHGQSHYFSNQRGKESQVIQSRKDSKSQTVRISKYLQQCVWLTLFGALVKGRGGSPDILGWRAPVLGGSSRTQSLFCGKTLAPLNAPWGTHDVHFLHPIPGSSLSVRAGRQGHRSILFFFLKIYLSSLVRWEESSGSRNCLDSKPQVNRDSGEGRMCPGEAD